LKIFSRKEAQEVRKKEELEVAGCRDSLISPLNAMLRPPRFYFLRPFLRFFAAEFLMALLVGKRSFRRAFPLYFRTFFPVTAPLTPLGRLHSLPRLALGRGNHFPSFQSPTLLTRYHHNDGN
jgi:hypothetical protein